ncbi:MAG: DsbA family protein [Thermodesulfobacteriota bacterium]
MDKDGGILIAKAQSPGYKGFLRKQTEEAIGRGIFGAPTFVVGDELFWGNDRLEDAIDFYETKVDG